MDYRDFQKVWNEFIISAFQRTIPFVSFLSLDCLDIFGVSKNDIVGLLQNVVNRNPILSRRLHAHIFTVICGKPLSTETKVFRECRKAFAFVGGNTLPIGRGNASIDKGFLDIHSTADLVNDFKHEHVPSKKYLRKQTGTECSLKDGSNVSPKISLQGFLSYSFVLERAFDTHKDSAGEMPCYSPPRAL